MPISHYTNQYPKSPAPEQLLYENVLEETINLWGSEAFYIPRESFNPTDMLFGENPQSKFSKAFPLSLYINTVKKFEGQGDFFSKFGLDIRDQSTFVVSAMHFNRYIPEDLRPHPKEGDLLWIPVFSGLYEIRFVEEDLIFFTFGRRTPYAYSLQCDLFRYSHEPVQTGSDENIDDTQASYAYTVMLTYGTGNGYYHIGETVSYGNTTAIISKVSPESGTMLVYQTNGEFVVNASINLIGQTSNAQHSLVAVDDSGAWSPEEVNDNETIETDSDQIIDNSENNPFGYA